MKNFALVRNDVIDDVEKFNQDDVIAYLAVSSILNYRKGEIDLDKVSKFMKSDIDNAQKAINSLVEKGVLNKDGNMYQLDGADEIREEYEVMQNER